ncbi:poly-beta-1,6 N-acetyl-D-glucosamine export porin PgaA [Acinetobacter sp. ANC 4654]|uniref:poly-beta-1,6 N-acetyl-D-glucosamine export porin PgaA n=1 Tax=Acinetobacter sp. ANC 4654 TaxID=1977872 RepID=UPI000A344ED2|nr:poly-beta-1,6 N-acetyl-D-glucosamine export porin PgaA [Acinetobacter sp. ANC 4654]OTG98200.1 poly-beta-1,6 N-acetyl-D-glucosamine export porin PgaA [Acinetobacter sp. ANC 4654]
MNKMNSKLNILTLSCGTLLFSTLLHAELLYKDSAPQREEIVSLIKQGQVDVGLQKLRQLLMQQPDDQKLIADFVVIAYENKKFVESDVKYLNGIQITQFPEYGKVNVIKALRDLKKFELAEQWAKKFAETDQNQMWGVWIGVLQAEAGKTLESKETLAPLDINYIDPDYLAQLAYAYRMLDMPIEALNAASLAVEKNPNSSTQEQYVLALMANADYAKAEKYIQDNEVLRKQPQLRASAKISEFTQRIQNAVQYYKVLTYRDRGNVAYRQLNQVLADMAKFESQLPNDQNIRRQFYYEYIYALNERNLSGKVLEQIPKVGIPIDKMPPYVRQSIADAYLKDRKPKLAEALYKNLLKEKNYQTYEIYSGLYYALIEQEKYKEANQLILAMDKLLPTFQYSNAKGVDRVTHDDRIEYIALVGLNYVYRHEYAKAEAYFEDLVAKAPNNIIYQNHLAEVQRWREQPQRSEETLALWDGVEPVDQAIRINNLQNMQALGHIPEWRKLNAYLMEAMPGDSGVVKSKKELDDRDRASIQHMSTFSKSDSDNTALLNRLKGSREQDNLTRINSPWFYDTFRTYVDHSLRSADYTEGKIDDQRVGLGLEWESHRKAANILLSQSVDGGNDRFGVELNWSQWLGDHLQYVLGFNSQADIPLQAIKKGNEGKSYIVGLNLQKNESQEAGAAYQLTDIDDGNTRHEITGYVKQRVFAAPHNITSVTLGGYYGQNDNVLVDYFNPKESYSVEMILQHDWITWRRHDKNFTQHFEAAIGTFRQTSFPSEMIYNVFYQHDWQLSRTWNLNYGIGWGTHPYDGEDEKRTYATLGFKGNF